MHLIATRHRPLTNKTTHMCRERPQINTS